MVGERRQPWSATVCTLTGASKEEDLTSRLHLRKPPFLISNMMMLIPTVQFVY